MLERWEVAMGPGQFNFNLWLTVVLYIAALFLIFTVKHSFLYEGESNEKRKKIF
jgi:hypothetical protein